MAARRSGASRSGARKAAALAPVPPLDAWLAVSADYYWEQDAEHRFTVWRPTSARSDSVDARTLLGKTSAEACPAPGDAPDHWVTHRARLEAREAFRDVVHTLPGNDGRSRHLCLSGAPVFGAAGELLGYRGIARDAGALVRLEKLLALEGALARGLGEADDLASALPLVLKLTCEFGGFTSGSCWMIDEQGSALRQTGAFGSGAGSALAAGVPAPDWLQSDPVWLTDAGEGRETAAAWRSTLVVPVTIAGSPIGALELCTSETASPDAGFLQVLRGVAVQIGHLHARAAAPDRLRESESRFASTMALAAIGIAHVDDDGRFVYVNPQLCAMLGYSERELLERTVKSISHHEDVDTTHELSARLRSGAIASFKAEKRYLRKDGSVVWAGLTIAAKRDREGHKLYDISIVEDISARKEAEQCIHFLANHDALTALPNRARFTQLLAEASEAARRDKRRFAVLFVDLDRFKIINDSLGHEAGDSMLQAAAARLRGSVRASDVVARLGGDEFVVLLRDVGDPSIAGKVASNVLKALTEPVSIQGQDCIVSASIGICLHPDGDQEDQAVLRNADIAMYLAKQSGKNGYRLYVNELNVLATERAAVEGRLHAALEGEDYAVLFDARVSVATQAVAAFGARVHWTSAALDAVPPHKLARAAEAAGLLVPLNRKVLRAACEACAGWQRAGLPPVPVAVSVAAGQITDQAFFTEVREALLTTGLDARLLELDVTEDVLLYDPGRSARTLTLLKSLGVSIAIEAFGTGKASFADLQRFPLGALKLHATRVENIALDLDKQRYAEGVIALGRALGLDIVATGVAAAGDAEFLRANGCTGLEGPIAGEALTAAECATVLRDRG
jgi:diguanylate cyclase (GGDEF)-like protein/PAS domain S-box-containing protein